MLLAEYLSEFKIRREEIAFRTDLSLATINHYIAGTRKPTQKNAEKLEKETGGRVTVLESRGKDARRK